MDIKSEINKTFDNIRKTYSTVSEKLFSDIGLDGRIYFKKWLENKRNLYTFINTLDRDKQDKIYKLLDCSSDDIRKANAILELICRKYENNPYKDPLWERISNPGMFIADINMDFVNNFRNWLIENTTEEELTNLYQNDKFSHYIPVQQHIQNEGNKPKVLFLPKNDGSAKVRSLAELRALFGNR